MIKKVIAFCACAAMALSLAACSDVTNNEENLKNGNTTSTTTNPGSASGTNDSDSSDSMSGGSGADSSNVTIVDGEIDTLYYDIDVGDNWDLSTGNDSLLMLMRKGENEEESASNISIMYTTQFGGMTADQCLDALVKQYNGMDGYMVESSETKKIDDYNVCEVVLSTSLSGKTAKIKQICILDDENDQNAVIMTFTALSDYYDAIIDEVDRMAASVDFEN